MVDQCSKLALDHVDMMFHVFCERGFPVALEIARTCEKRRSFGWVTRRGTTSSMTLSRGWLTVRDALGLPVPDTSWMDHAIPQRQFTQWLNLR